jgi:hypothetical protein
MPPVEEQIREYHDKIGKSKNKEVTGDRYVQDFDRKTIVYIFFNRVF